MPLLGGVRADVSRCVLLGHAALTCCRGTHAVRAVAQLVPGVTYLELMEHVRQLYPAAGPFVLKFVDK